MAWKDLFKKMFTKQLSGYSIVNSLPFVYSLPSVNEIIKEAMINPYVVSAIERIALAISNLDFYIANTQNERVNTPDSTLLYKVNPKQTFAELLYEAVWWYYLTGNVYIQKIFVGNKIKALSLIPSLNVRIATDNQGNVTEYQVLKGTEIVKLLPNNVIHISYKNPFDGIIGSSPLSNIYFSIKLNNEVRAWNIALLKNGARPSGALVSQQTLTIEQFNRLKQQIDAQFTGSANAGRPLLLEGGLQWQQIGFNPNDMDYLETVKHTAREITIGLGVPAELIGDPDTKTYSNYKEALRQFYVYTVSPLAERFCGAISEALPPEFVIRIEYEKIDALREELDSEWQRIMNAVDKGLLTINEARQLLGFKPISSGDAVYITANKIPLGTVISEDENNY